MSDHTDIKAIEKRFCNAKDQLLKLSPDLADAITIIDYDPDRRKNLRAKYNSKYIVGSTAAAAEIAARSDPDYLAEFEGLFSQRQNAEKVKANYRAIEKAWDTSRSLLSSQKEQLRQIEG